jgi:hypothetical protein
LDLLRFTTPTTLEVRYWMFPFVLTAEEAHLDQAAGLERKMMGP